MQKKGRRYWQLANGKWEVQVRRPRYRTLKTADGGFAQVSRSILKALGQVMASPEFYKLFKKIHGERMRK